MARFSEVAEECRAERAARAEAAAAGIQWIEEKLGNAPAVQVMAAEAAQRAARRRRNQGSDELTIVTRARREAERVLERDRRAAELGMPSFQKLMTPGGMMERTLRTASDFAKASAVGSVSRMADLIAGSAKASSLAGGIAGKLPEKLATVASVGSEMSIIRGTFEAQSRAMRDAIGIRPDPPPIMPRLQSAADLAARTERESRRRHEAALIEAQRETAEIISRNAERLEQQRREREAERDAALAQMIADRLAEKRAKEPTKPRSEARKEKRPSALVKVAVLLQGHPEAASLTYEQIADLAGVHRSSIARNKALKAMIEAHREAARRSSGASRAGRRSRSRDTDCDIDETDDAT